MKFRRLKSGYPFKKRNLTNGILKHLDIAK